MVSPYRGFSPVSALKAPSNYPSYTPYPGSDQPQQPRQQQPFAMPGLFGLAPLSNPAWMNINGGNNGGGFRPIPLPDVQPVNQAVNLNQFLRPMTMPAPYQNFMQDLQGQGVSPAMARFRARGLQYGDMKRMMGMGYQFGGAGGAMQAMQLHGLNNLLGLNHNQFQAGMGQDINHGIDMFNMGRLRGGVDQNLGLGQFANNQQIAQMQTNALQQIAQLNANSQRDWMNSQLGYRRERDQADDAFRDKEFAATQEERKMAADAAEKQRLRELGLTGRFMENPVRAIDEMRQAYKAVDQAVRDATGSGITTHIGGAVDATGNVVRGAVDGTEMLSSPQTFFARKLMPTPSSISSASRGSQRLSPFIARAMGWPF